MILHSITLHNFRQFIGTQKINFIPINNDVNKNITVIIGRNGSGKTTFSLACLWCLYGNDITNPIFDKEENILNDKVFSDMTNGIREEAYVELTFENGGVKYTIKRSQKFLKINDEISPELPMVSLLYKTSTGETERMEKSQIAYTINSILPRNLASFIFYQGEKDNIVSNKNLKEDIETLVGLDAHMELVKHLYGNRQSHASSDSVIGQYLSEQINNNDTETQDKKRRIDQLTAQIDDNERLIEETNNQIQKYDDKIKEIENSLIQAAPSIEIRNRIQDLKNQEQHMAVELEEKNREFIKLLDRESYSLFIYPFLNKLKDKLAQLNIDNVGIRGLEASVINELLQRGRCLCETDLKEGTSARRNVEKYLETVPPHSIGNIVKELQDKISEYEDKAKDFVSVFQEKYKKIIATKNELLDSENCERNIIKQLQNTETIDVNQLKEDLQRYKNDYRNQIERCQGYTNSQQDLNQQLSKLNKEYTESAARNANTQNIRKYYNYALQVYNRIQSHIMQASEEIKNKLREECQKIFNAIYDGEKEVIIDQRYQIRLLSNGHELPISEGIQTIMYFSYIGAIVKILRNVIADRNELLDSVISREDYPLLLDAAFSNTDEIHTPNIPKEIANTVPQLIFAVSYKDWYWARQDRSVIAKVSRIYTLNKESENITKIVEGEKYE